MARYLRAADGGGLRRLTRVTRVTLAFSSWFLVTLAFGAQRAHAAGTALLSELGDRLSQVIAPENTERDERIVRLNGLALHLSVTTTSTEISDVLTQFARVCHARAPRLRDELSKLRAPRWPQAVAWPAWLDGVIEAHDDQHGFVACLDTGNAALTHTALATRLRAFFANLDVAQVGDVRYLTAQRDATDSYTRVVLVWSDGSLPLGRAFTTHGDVPGSDLRDAPRPEAARRVLSTSQDGAPYQLNAYASHALDARAFLHAYKRQLEAAGYHVTNSTLVADTQLALQATREALMLNVIARNDDAGHGLLTLALAR